MKIKVNDFSECQKYFNLLITCALKKKKYVSSICNETECVHQFYPNRSSEIFINDLIQRMSSYFNVICDDDVHFFLRMYKTFCYFAVNGVSLCKQCINNLCHYNTIYKILNHLKSKHKSPLEAVQMFGNISTDSTETQPLFDDIWFEYVNSEAMVIIILYFAAKCYPKIFNKIILNSFDLLYFGMQRLFFVASKTYIHKKYMFDDKGIDKVFINDDIGALPVKYIDLHKLLKYVWIIIINTKLLLNPSKCLTILKSTNADISFKLDSVLYNFGTMICVHYVNSDIKLDKNNINTLFPGIVTMSIVYNYCYRQITSTSDKKRIKNDFLEYCSGLSNGYYGCFANVILPICAMIFDENYIKHNSKSIFGKPMNKTIRKIYKNEKKQFQCSNNGCSKMQKNKPFKICKACKSRRYCGKKCQKIHWNIQHRLFCNKT